MAGVGAINIDVGSAFNFLGTLIDKIFPDKTKAEEIKAEMLKAQMSGNLEEFKQVIQVYVNEAASTDKWTSRARPSFMYVMYIFILCAIPAGILSIFNNEAAVGIAKGMGAWMGAIPTALWGVFGACFSVYTIARSYDKSQGSQ